MKKAFLQFYEAPEVEAIEFKAEHRFLDSSEEFDNPDCQCEREDLE